MFLEELLMAPISSVVEIDAKLFLNEASTCSRRRAPGILAPKTDQTELFSLDFPSEPVFWIKRMAFDDDDDDDADASIHSSSQCKFDFFLAFSCLTTSSTLCH